VTVTLPSTGAVVEDGYVPVVSLAGVEDPRRREEIARELGDALRRSGFYIVVDHDVPRPLFDDLCAAAFDFFHLPTADKERFGPAPGDRSRRGWTTNYRAAARIGVETDEDAAEAWTMNPYDEGLGWRDLAVLEPRFRSAFVHPNRFPPVPGFRRNVVPYFVAMETQILTLLGLHAIDLDLPPDYFSRLLAGAMTNLAINYYPPMHAEPKPNQSCLGPHTDLGVMTGLMHSGQRGLQVVDRTDPDHWVAVPDQPGGIVINAGDLLVLASGGRYQSALHRVVCSSTNERVSIPVFMQPAPQTKVAPACPPPPASPGFEPVLFAEYFAHRIGIMYDDDTPATLS
jgi:isopenicillin N synthase-like dioxygenase